MWATLRRCWPVLKPLLGLAIVLGVGWQFYRLLSQPQLHDRPADWPLGGLAAAAGLYAVGLACWGGYWLLLMRRQGEPLTLGRAARAYFVSQLGKYVPGKAWAILLRATLVRPDGVRPGRAALLATYETLTSMAAGALIGVALWPWLAGAEALGWKALGLLALAGVPILPGVFNALTRRVQRAFPDAAGAAPPLRLGTLALGLLQAGAGWALMGTGLWLLLWAWPVGAVAAGAAVWLRCTAALAVAYVAGFLTLPAPGGLGVREALLQPFVARELAASLSPERADAEAVLVVLLLRLAWTAAELLAAAVTLAWPLPARSPGGAAVHSQGRQPLVGEGATVRDP
jgi:glycosyltransferase 2 family protein